MQLGDLRGRWNIFFLSEVVAQITGFFGLLRNLNCGIGNTNLLEPSSSGLGYDYFYMKSTMYFNLGSGIGSERFQTDYGGKLREKDEK